MLAAPTREAGPIRVAGIAASLPGVAEGEHIARRAAGEPALNKKLQRLLDRSKAHRIELSGQAVAMQFGTVDTRVDAACPVKWNIGAANVSRWRDELHNTVLAGRKAECPRRRAAEAKPQTYDQADQKPRLQPAHHTLVFLRDIRNPCPSRVQVSPVVADLQTNGPRVVVFP